MTEHIEQLLYLLRQLAVIIGAKKRESDPVSRYKNWSNSIRDSLKITYRATLTYYRQI